MPEYVMVPVPPELVTAVMKLITEHEQGTAAPTSSAVLPAAKTETASPFVTEESREWPGSQLQALSDGTVKSIKLFCEVLDILAAGPREGMKLEDVAEITGVPALKMQNSFGRATVWMRNHIDEDTRWPVYFPGDRWALSDHNRELWKSIRG